LCNMNVVIIINPT